MKMCRSSIVIFLIMSLSGCTTMQVISRELSGKPGEYYIPADIRDRMYTPRFVTDKPVARFAKVYFGVLTTLGDENIADESSSYLFSTNETGWDENSESQLPKTSALTLAASSIGTRATSPVVVNTEYWNQQAKQARDQGDKEAARIFEGNALASAEVLVASGQITASADMASATLSLFSQMGAMKNNIYMINRELEIFNYLTDKSGLIGMDAPLPYLHVYILHRIDQKISPFSEIVTDTIVVTETVDTEDSVVRNSKSAVLKWYKHEAEAQGEWKSGGEYVKFDIPEDRKSSDHKVTHDQFGWELTYQKLSQVLEEMYSSR